MTKRGPLGKLKRLFKRIHVNRSLILLILFIFVYCEFFCYKLLTHVSWPRIPEINPRAVRMLLVSDPQLPGHMSNPTSITAAIARSDVDRYIKSTYHEALHYTQPDVIIFLGDLLDEGSVAGENEFKAYVKRFYNVFDIKKHHEERHHIFVPGDNDIGGEGWDRATPEKVERFEYAFHAPIEDEEIFKFITFDKANIMPGARSQLKHAQPQNRGEAYQQTVKILLSHFPLTEPDARRPQGDEMVRKFNPSIIFSGHEHQSFFLHDGNKQSFEMQKGVVNLNILDHQSEKEMVVPSCNYKMGAAGFGFAVVQQDGSLFYTILWLPPRSKVLVMYLIFIPVLLVLINLDKAFRNQSFFSWLMEGAIDAKDKVTKQAVFTKRAQRKFRD